MIFGPTVDPVLLTPNIETLAINYLQAALAPTPVTTRVPTPSIEADTINGLLRVEDGGGSKPNRFQYDKQCILLGYSPDEIQAQRITARAVALMGAGRGQTVSDGTYEWYIVGVMGVVDTHRATDPDVILPRFRATVTWRVAGQQWNP